MILDTCFFIDLDRKNPDAIEFIKTNGSERLYLTVITAGELACGFDTTDLPKLWAQLRHFEILEVTSEAVQFYGRTFRKLKQSGKLIGTNDLWIASVALAHKMPVVTRNIDEFSRVPGLQVMAY